MYRPAVANIHLHPLSHNYRIAQSLCPTGGQALAVVKADGYGHGAVAVAEALAMDAPAYGVACIEEALELRAAGIAAPILLLEGFFTADEIPLMIEHRFWTMIHCPEQLETLVQQLNNSSVTRPISVWLKVDTGMHRLGFSVEQADTACRQLLSLPNVSDLCLMTHFANADLEQPTGVSQSQQLQRFQAFANKYSLPTSVANSAAMLSYPNARLNWQRPGIMLYGASPLEKPSSFCQQLQPVMHLESAVIATRWIDSGESVGYGSRFTATQPTRVATVAIGYADGYPRQAREGTPVAIDGKITQLIGRVSMDMITVDITHIPEAGVGSKAQLWGDLVSANQVARCCDTIAYHLFTGVTKRVPRRYCL